MKNISILQIKSACQRGNPKTYFLTLVEGRRTRRWSFAFPPPFLTTVGWLLFWQPGIFQFGTRDLARSLCKFISSFLTQQQQHYQATSDLRPATSGHHDDDDDDADDGDVALVHTRTYILVDLPTWPGSLPG